MVLDHPLPIGLGHDRPGVARAEPRRDALTVFVGGRRHDAVDCRRGAGHLRFHEGAEIAVGKRGEAADDALQDAAVRGEVVAGQQRERRRAGRAPAPQGGDDQARRGARGLAVGEVMHDVGMRLVQRAGRRVVAIALFGDGQRHDPYARVAHGCEDALDIRGRNQHLAHAADDAEPLAFAGAQRLGV
jgi:hypothetical protein